VLEESLARPDEDLEPGGRPRGVLGRARRCGALAVAEECEPRLRGRHLAHLVAEPAQHPGVDGVDAVRRKEEQVLHGRRLRAAAFVVATVVWLLGAAATAGAARPLGPSEESSGS